MRRSSSDCNPPLIPFFLKLGYRPHLGWIDHAQCGRVFSMMLHLDDTDYLQAIDSPFLRTALDAQPTELAPASIDTTGRAAAS